MECGVGSAGKAREGKAAILYVPHVCFSVLVHFLFICLSVYTLPLPLLMPLCCPVCLYLCLPSLCLVIGSVSLPPSPLFREKEQKSDIK